MGVAQLRGAPSGPLQTQSGWRARHSPQWRSPQMQIWPESPDPNKTIPAEIRRSWGLSWSHIFGPVIKHGWEIHQSMEQFDYRRVVVPSMEEQQLGLSTQCWSTWSHENRSRRKPHMLCRRKDRCYSVYGTKSKEMFHGQVVYMRLVGYAHLTITRDSKNSGYTPVGPTI